MVDDNDTIYWYSYTICTVFVLSSSNNSNWINYNNEINDNSISNTIKHQKIHHYLIYIL